MFVAFLRKNESEDISKSNYLLLKFVYWAA